jgi:hypothetical protein
MSAEQLKIIFERGTLSVESTLQQIESVLAKHLVPLSDFTLYEQPVTLPMALQQIQRRKRKTFHLSGQGFEFVLGSVGNYDVDFLEIKSVARPSIPWDEWTTPFVSNPHFVMAWVVDYEYDYWQNASDPLQYTAVGKSYSHLRMKSNGLPYPLEQQIVDTACNPGRWRFGDGYIEAVGAVLWLGNPFWALTGANQEQVEGTAWLRVSHPADSVTKLQVADQNFTTADGTSGDLQTRLRSLLFPAQALATKS